MTYFCQLEAAPEGGFLVTFPDVRGAIADQLRKLRAGLSQAEIARRIGVSTNAYQKLENARTNNPSITTLSKVAKAFGKQLLVSIE